MTIRICLWSALTSTATVVGGAMHYSKVRKTVLTLPHVCGFLHRSTAVNPSQRTRQQHDQLFISLPATRIQEQSPRRVAERVDSARSGIWCLRRGGIERAGSGVGFTSAVRGSLKRKGKERAATCASSILCPPSVSTKEGLRMTAAELPLALPLFDKWRSALDNAALVQRGMWLRYAYSSSLPPPGRKPTQRSCTPIPGPPSLRRLPFWARSPAPTPRTEQIVDE